jgi:hypothetical protein
VRPQVFAHPRTIAYTHGLKSGTNDSTGPPNIRQLEFTGPGQCRARALGCDHFGRIAFALLVRLSGSFQHPNNDIQRFLHIPRTHRACNHLTQTKTEPVRLGFWFCQPKRAPRAISPTQRAVTPITTPTLLHSLSLQPPPRTFNGQAISSAYARYRPFGAKYPTPYSFSPTWHPTTSTPISTTYYTSITSLLQALRMPN